MKFSLRQSNYHSHSDVFRWWSKLVERWPGRRADSTSASGHRIYERQRTAEWGSPDGVRVEAWRIEKGEMNKERWISCHPWSTTNQVSIFRFTVNGFRLRFKSFLSCIALNQYIGFRLIECTSIVLKWGWMSFVLSEPISLFSVKRWYSAKIGGIF